MNIVLKDVFETFWSRPDPALSQAVAEGERLVAKCRLVMSCMILPIPLAYFLHSPAETQEGIIATCIILGVFLFSVASYIFVRHYTPPWISFLSSGLDATVVSGGLALFLFLNQPHTAVNSRVAFEGYFITIGSSSLRYDKRVCITTGLLAIAQYFGIVLYAATHWDLNNVRFSPYTYGLFSWSNEIGRLILMAVACLLSVALVTRSHKLLRLANTDNLTGLYNRGYIDTRLSAELSRAARYGNELAIAVIDVDHFKTFNDTHGHSDGDVALRAIGGVLTRSFRESDTVGRFGGEEFVVIMPETDLNAAHRKIESLRSAVAGTPIGLSSRKVDTYVTISAGVASFPGDAASQEELFGLADGRLFQAKHEGRNRVVAASEALV
jgi:diguanylate cyclase (GGDEF)-like protein